VSEWFRLCKATSLSLLDPSEASPRSSWPAAMTRSNLCGSRHPFRQIHTTVPCLRSTSNGTVYLGSNLWRDLPSRRQTNSAFATLPKSSLPGCTCHVAAGLSRSVRFPHVVLFSKISKSGFARSRKLVLKAFIAADILISCFTNMFILRIIFGSASTQLCGSSCAGNHCVAMRCKTSQQPLPDGEYAKEKLGLMLHLSQKV